MSHPYDSGWPILDEIAELTDALKIVERDNVSTAESRISLIRQARADGHTLEAIGSAAGITRQRVGQLLERGET